MTTEFIPPINYPIIEPVPSHFFPKPKNFKFELCISGSILATDPKNLCTDSSSPISSPQCEDCVGTVNMI